MIKTIEELKAVHPTVVNEVDDPSVLSTSSVSPLDANVGDLEEGEVENKEEKVVVEKTEKKEEADSSKTEEKEVESSLPQKRDKVQERIDDLTKKRRVAERQAEFERAKRLEAEEELKKLKTKIPATDRPKKADFENEDDYLEALIDWKAEQKIKGAEEGKTKASVEEKEKTAVQEADAELDEVMEKGRGMFKDFNATVLDENLILSKDLIETVLSTDKPEELLYYLGKNPDEAENLSKQAPLAIMYELGKIKTGMSIAFTGDEKKEKEEKASSQKKITKAPAPIIPVKSSGVIDKDPNDMSPKEYRAWRERNKG